ncbi:MAG: hypothetical protein Q9214_001455, partial [Letrouitia sp. 1 TL-2023]
MDATDAQKHNRPIAVAPVPPAPTKASSTDLGVRGDSPQPTMPYTCQACVKRKVRCDKAKPICSSCRKVKLECFYQVPPSQHKRKHSGDVDERLAQYERILHQHGLLPQDADTQPSMEETAQEPISLLKNEPETSKTGELRASQGKPRSIDSSLWRNLGDDDDKEENQMITSVARDFVSDPLSEAFMGSQQSLLQYHPTHAKAMILCKRCIE